MPDLNPPTEYRGNIARSSRGNALRAGLRTPGDAEEHGELMDLKQPEAPVVIRRLGRVEPIW